MTTRFRRGSKAPGQQVNWHIAVQDYKKGEIYRRYLALCGYEIKMPWATRAETQLSRAKRVDGPKCQKCIKKLAEETS